MAQRMAKLAFITTAVISAFLIANKEWRWASGLAVAVIWSVINFSLIVMILEAAILKETKVNIPRILMIKFPVLYLAGFWILTSRAFPTMSLLAGMTITLGFIGVVNIWPKQS